MGLEYIIDGFYKLTKEDEKNIVSFIGKPINKISAREFRKWYHRNKIK
jgi:hypothetical protein